MARQSVFSLATLLFGITASILLARVLGPEARGEYQLALRLAGLVLAVAQWGIPELLLQLLPERGDVAALAGTGLAVGLSAAAVTAVLLLLAAPLLAESLLRGVEPTLLVLSLGGSLVVVVQLLLRRFLQLRGDLTWYNVSDAARTGAFLALAALLTLGLHAETLGAVLAWLLAELGLAAAAAWRFRRRVSARLALDGGLVPVFLRHGTLIQLGVLGTFLGNEGGAFVLNATVDLAAVGVYAVALSVARLVTQVSQALRTVLQPRLVADEADSAEITARVTRHGLLIMVVLSLALAAGSPLVPIVFGAAFQSAAGVLLLALPGMVAYGLMQLLAGHLLRIGARRLLAFSSWAFAAASIGFQLAGATAFGLPGAAAGLSLAYVLAAAIVLRAYLARTAFPLSALVPRPSDLAYYREITRRLWPLGRST